MTITTLKQAAIIHYLMITHYYYNYVNRDI